jgi:hypothetical protein
MADGELSFDEHAREAVLALREAGLKVGESEAHLLAMLADIGQDPGHVKGLSSALDAIDKGIGQSVDIVALVIGMHQLGKLMGDELAEHEAAQGPPDIRDRPPAY